MTEARSSTSNLQVSTQGASFVTTSVNPPKLIRTDAESIRVFLRLYDQYSKEVTARAQQLTIQGTTTTEAIRPVNLKYCVDPEYLESALALGFIKDISDYDALTDQVLRACLDEKAQESKEDLTLEALDNIFTSELVMDICDKNSKSRMETLFLSYYKMLRRNGIAWLLKKNQKVAVYHVLSVVKPKALQHRLESDLDFAHFDCRKDFSKFLAHTIQLSEDFQLVGNGPKSKREDSGKDKKTRGGTHHKGGNSPSGTIPKPPQGKGNKPLSQPSGYPYGSCKARGLKH